MGVERGVERARRAGLLAALALAGAGSAGAQEPAAPAVASDVAAEVARYHALGDWEALLSSWLGSGLCEELSLGRSFGERKLFGVQFGGWGQTPLAERTTVFLVGGLDGVSLSGAEAVVRAVGALLSMPDRLPADVTFVAIPWANPDGLERTRAGGAGDGRNDRPLDDDLDGQVDEDGPDDMDGDGLILDLLVEDPAGSWARCTDGRFLRSALPGEAPRYTLAREGRDEDRDGRYNEDGVGGVAPERNFPADWRGPLLDRSGGQWPLSEPCARALADLILARKSAVVLLFQGNHGDLALPLRAPLDSGALDGAAWDRQAFATLRSLFARATDRPLAAEPPSARTGESPPGNPLDWLYGTLGVLAAEVACWGPDIESSASDARDARFVPGEWSTEARLSAPELRELSDDDRSWLRWLDDTRGGLGFIDWQPVDLGDGRQGLVGGWEPWTCTNPPLAVLDQALAGVERFVLDVALALPRLDLELVEARRDGGLCILRARVRNSGALAAGLLAASPASRLSVELELSEGVLLLAGETLHALAPVPGSGAGEELSWLLVAPEGSVFTFRVRSPWSATAVHEVRL